MFDVSSLSPEEKKMLLDALAGHDEATEQSDDMQQDLSLIQPLADAIKFLQQKVDSLEDLVVNNLMKPFGDLYSSQERDYGMKDMVAKYGEKLSPFKDFYSTLSGGKDLHETLFDKLSEMKGETPDWNDETESSAIDSAIQELTGIIEKLKGVPGATTVEVSAEPVEAVKAEPTEEEKAAADSNDLIAKVKAMKSKKNPMSLS